jgi:hypothetical protein
MPIRINLLAEQKEAEELRRRDPVKRAFWGAGVLVALVLLWSLNLQFKVVQAKGELQGEEARWSHLEPQFLSVSNNWNELRSIENRLESLTRYVTNRFLWTEALNALQFAAVDNVRIVRLEGSQSLIETKPARFETNLVFNLPEQSWWRFWGEKPSTNVEPAIHRVLGMVTNNTNFVRFQSVLNTTVTGATNPVRITANIKVVKPETITERITLRVLARDYSDPSGSRVDPFYEALTNTAFFQKNQLTRTNTSVQPEIMLRQDPQDLINSNSFYIPFTVEGRLPERIRAHE